MGIKLNFEVSVELDELYFDDISEAVKSSLKDDVIREIKKSPEYKAALKEETKKLLSKLNS